MSSTPFLIPLQPATPQVVNVTMASVNYILTVRWNAQSSSWMIDIADSSGNPIVSGIAMVTGADLLEQFGYLNFGGQLRAWTKDNTDAVPTFGNLGGNGNLYFLLEATSG